MIDELLVRNLGVIEEATLEPGPGLTVITGETGAGKTLLVGAVRLLLGETADPSSIGPFGDEAVVEGRLIDDHRELVVARRMSREGRSRAYIDGSMASAAALGETVGELVDVVGQYEHLSLRRPSEIRRMVDRLIDPAVLEAYRTAWERLRAARQELDELGGDRRALEVDAERAEREASRIASAGIRAGEDEELDSRLRRLRNVRRLAELVSEAVDGLAAIREEAGRVLGVLQKAAAIDPAMARLVEAGGSLEAVAEELALDVSSLASELDDDPSGLEAAEERMRLLNDLKRLYGPTLDDVLEAGRRLSLRAERLRSLLNRADTLEGELAGLEAELEARAAELTRARREAGAELCRTAVAHLQELGFDSPILEAEVGPAVPGPWGADELRLEFASDRRLAPGDVARTASGGELSRVVLALRLASNTEGASLVFDEVDAGVGGGVAIVLGRKLAALATRRQVLCVTHLPQVAAFAGTHYVVERTGARATVRRLDEEGRTAELARMLAGAADSEGGLVAARELLRIPTQDRPDG
jgi:DNA repair protein RecN (Recombination protein N)